ncbi:MAG TPA: peptidoglycan-binding protein LysM [Prolixibacteraceae bacterium]|jgi:hypothetical protein|nr:peptidoglycan-binding protein LysM [Prolixibacteraceae bacterium]
MKTFLSILVVILSVGYSSLGQQSDWANVEKVFGKKGTIQDGVFKITFPRSDLKIKVGDFAVDPGLALTSWIGFINQSDGDMKMNGKTMMMGDLVLLEKEVGPVISKIVSLNLEVTALHNHLIGETPAIKYVHFSGKGEAVQLAEAIKSVISVTGTPLTSPQAPNQDVKPDWSKVEAVLGTTGKHNGNLLQYGFPRLEKLTESGMVMPPSIGMAIAINFQMAGNKAAITGDFVLLPNEVNPVLKALTQNGIAVTAIHNHMLYDDPRLFMMHFWAVDDPEKLAKGLKAALNQTNSKK